MLDFNIVRDPKTGDLCVETSITGKPLLTLPQLNKSTAFTQEERQAFGLLGKLPHRIETLEEQVERAYQQYASYKTRMQQNIYLNNLHDKNQILFYKLLSCHLGDMLPTIYTPIVGTAVKRFSHEYRQPRGLYIAHTDKDWLEDIVSNRSNPEIDIIVVTDGEGVLGIGDQGIGGMDIPVAKLMVYTLCGGIDPSRTLPVFLDVGTNNPDLLADPLYLGCRHPRIDTAQYDDFIDTFVATIHRHFPHAFLHWEDFGRSNARRILDKYEQSLCTFNDDIQGTGAVALAALLAACDLSHIPLDEHRIVVFGAGSAGTGISDQLVDAMVRRGLSEEAALQRFWLIDRNGLLQDTDTELTEAQQRYARKATATPLDNLVDIVREVKPTILIGCSAQTGAFSEEVIKLMSEFCQYPVIFPLSNPDEKCEALPADIIKWSEGRALIATGTAFPPVEYQNRHIQIAQCNNALIFPGIGLGVLAVHAKQLSKGMLWAAAQALSDLSPARKDSSLPLLPSLNEAQSAARYIALVVAEAAINEGLATRHQSDNLEQVIEELFWKPEYLPFKKREVITQPD